MLHKKLLAFETLKENIEPYSPVLIKGITRTYVSIVTKCIANGNTND